MQRTLREYFFGEKSLHPLVLFTLTTLVVILVSHMPKAKKIRDNHGLYFITFTCFQWLDLFSLTDSYGLVYKWFDHLKGKMHHVVGFVIMPNHMHAIINFSATEKSINAIVGNGKRFLAYGIVDRLEKLGRCDILTKLYLNVSGTDRQRGKIHEVWERFFLLETMLHTKVFPSKTELYTQQSLSGEKKAG